MSARPTVHWIGGWVSSLACWEPQLRALFPDFEHRFLDAHDLLDASPSQAGLAGLPPGDVVAAWSLGSLRAHLWMEEGAWPDDRPLLSLCPVFRFAQPAASGASGAFGESVLLRMEKKLGPAREAVLLDFWRRMPKAAGMAPEWEANWIAATRRYDDASVLEALRFLRLRTVEDPSALRVPQAGWRLLAGSQDRLAPAASWKDALPSGARLQVYEGGHLPFQECPEAVGEALRRLSSGGGTHPAGDPR